MKIKYKLISAFAGLGLLVASISVIYIYQSKWPRRLVEFHTPSFSLVQKIAATRLQATEKGLVYVISGDLIAKDLFYSRMNDFQEQLRQFKKLELLVDKKKARFEIKLLAVLDSNIEVLMSRARAMFNEYEAKRAISLETIIRYQDISDKLSRDIHGLVAKEAGEVESAQLLVIQALTSARMAHILLGVLAVTLSIGIGTIIALNISRPIINLRDAALAMSKGNMEYEIKVKGRDEIGEMAQAFEVMRKSLRRSRLQLENEINQHGQVQQELVQSERRYRQLVENAGEAIVVVQDGIVKFANAEAGRLAQSSVQELVAKPYRRFIHPEDKQKVEQYYMSRLQRGAPSLSFISRFIDSFGKTKRVQLSTTYIDWEGRTAGLCFITDISGPVQVEESLRESLAEKEALLQKVHHGAKNKLETIITQVETIRQFQQTVGGQVADSSLVDLNNRIRSMALADEQLILSREFSRTDHQG